MADELAELIKKYVREAIDEYFRTTWQDYGEGELPHPPLLFIHPRHFRGYRESYDRFNRDMASLSHSVQFLAEITAKFPEWSPKCTEKEKIEGLTKDMGEIKEAMTEIRDTLKQIASKMK